MNIPNRNAILVIDPDASVRTLILALLRYEGYVTDAAANPDEALRLHRAARHAAIVLDPRVLGGDSLLEALQTADEGGRPSRNLIVVTTPDHRHRSWAGHPAVNAVLSKPFRIDDLSAAVAACCEQQL